MIDMKELERMGLEAGFTHVALLKSSTIELMPEVREMCEKNTCHRKGLSFRRLVSWKIPWTERL